MGHVSELCIYIYKSLVMNFLEWKNPAIVGFGHYLEFACG